MPVILTESNNTSNDTLMIFLANKGHAFIELNDYLAIKLFAENKEAPCRKANKCIRRK